MLNKKMLLTAINNHKNHKIHDIRECLSILVVENPNEDWHTLLHNLAGVSFESIRSVWKLGEKWQPVTLQQNIRIVAKELLDVLTEKNIQSIIKECEGAKAHTIHLNSHLTFQAAEKIKASKLVSFLKKELVNMDAPVLQTFFNDVDTTARCLFEAHYKLSHAEFINALITAMCCELPLNKCKRDIVNKYVGEMQ